MSLTVPLTAELSAKDVSANKMTAGEVNIYLLLDLNRRCDCGSDQVTPAVDACSSLRRNFFIPQITEPGVHLSGGGGTSTLL